MFSTFLISGATDVDKMLKIYNRSGYYLVQFHEFIKSVILGDRRYYKESASKVFNLFNCSAERNSSHFTAIRLLKFLQKRRSNFSVEGQGYIEIAKTVTIFDDLFDNREDLISIANRLLKWNLIKYLPYQGSCQIFSRMKRHSCNSSITVPIKGMTAFLAYFFKTHLQKQLFHGFTIDSLQLAHPAISICCNPTNSGNEFFSSGSISSKHNSTTSFNLI